MGDIGKEVANTLYPDKKYKKRFSNCATIRGRQEQKESVGQGTKYSALSIWQIIALHAKMWTLHDFSPYRASQPLVYGTLMDTEWMDEARTGILRHGVFLAEKLAFHFQGRKGRFRARKSHLFKRPYFLLESGLRMGLLRTNCTKILYGIYCI